MVTRFLPQGLSLAQAGAQTVTCGDAALPQQVRNTRQMSYGTFPSTEVAAIFRLSTRPKMVRLRNDAGLKNARAPCTLPKEKKDRMLKPHAKFEACNRAPRFASQVLLLRLGYCQTRFSALGSNPEHQKDIISSCHSKNTLAGNKHKKMGLTKFSMVGLWDVHNVWPRCFAVCEWWEFHDVTLTEESRLPTECAARSNFSIGVGLTPPST